MMFLVPWYPCLWVLVRQVHVDCPREERYATHLALSPIIIIIIIVIIIIVVVVRPMPLWNLTPSLLKGAVALNNIPVRCTLWCFTLIWLINGP